MAPDLANIKRDQRLRAKLLQCLYGARSSPLGGLSGRFLLDVIDSPPTQGFEDEQHARGLLQDLVAKLLVEKTDKRTRRTQVYSIDYLFFKILAKGVSLVEQTIPPDPDIDDERNLES